MKRELISATEAGRDGDEIIPHQPVREFLHDEAETDEEAQQRGPDEQHRFWDEQIAAALTHENRWRTEALDCEIAYFGRDDDPGRGSDQHASGGDPNRITDKQALIHANIDVLKPLIYSETPQPLVRRRFRGDGRHTDPTDLMVAEAAQRVAQFLIEDGFDDAMAGARDDYLIAGRGAARVIYKADFEKVKIPNPETGQPFIDPETGEEIEMEFKSDECVKTSYSEWQRLLFAPSHSWDQMPWLAYEVPMTRASITRRFGKEKADAISYVKKGLKGQSRADGDEERENERHTGDLTDTFAKTVSPFDTVSVWEIWDKENRKVIWWCKEYPVSVLDMEDDPLGLEDFYPMPAPLLATTKGKELTPRPDIKYYEGRADEIDETTNKMLDIMEALSVSGVFPGTMKEEVRKLLSGKNQMIPIEDWVGLIEKGGVNNIIQWLPIDQMIKALQALDTMRDRAKQAMFEASGVSDIMRAQGDPSETATAQQIKGRYAGLRLSDRQQYMAVFARNMIRLMVEVAVEHFDTTTLAEICGLDIPLTEAERQQAMANNEILIAKFQQEQQDYQNIVQLIQQSGLEAQMPPEPTPPELQEVAETSWELVHDKLKQDRKRKLTISIETNSTILADEQADKEARIEFLGAFANFVEQLVPLVGTGQFDFKTIKELLLFGVRGFSKSRTLEAMIADIPDEPQQQEEKEDIQVTVAKIRAASAKELKEMELADNEADRQHESKKKAADVVMDGQKIIASNQPQPPQNPQK
ncbi:MULTISPECIES: hypothetical protein [Halocynthiibacter]|uniref:Portal protein n=1 Tax=Halocynthiibacter halioticoli TaxID=2986804 RepID=A0AAE3J127_9RHOB|nr:MULTISPECIES: hypothetical protein [Halocynthiibacter]MCV6826012.1 hypothetical protein [Halocynthiibacter halioticoli]MCW4059013.1 hypothetical protein [Halocynthiibacter sp. SDUM655004]